MRSTKRILFSLAMMVLAARVDAYPLLQLDIVNGTYDPVTETVISGGPDFTLIALLTPKASNDVSALLSDTYYVSAALMPTVGPIHSDIGGFTWDGTHYDATGSMTFGTPPLEGLDASYDAGDFNDPNIFPTFFSEFAFTFDPNQRVESYSVPQHAGGDLHFTSATAGISYFRAFNITTSFTGNNVLHFDLYDTYVKRCRYYESCEFDEEIEHYAPLNADAQSTNAGVPEPAGFALMTLGLAFAFNRVRESQR